MWAALLWRIGSSLPSCMEVRSEVKCGQPFIYVVIYLRPQFLVNGSFGPRVLAVEGMFFPLSAFFFIVVVRTGARL